MREREIKEEVIRYIDDKNYNYALLIDGEWGSGKTYFITHDIKSVIENHEQEGENRTFKYISLYGIKSTDEMEESIFWSILDENIFKFKDKIEGKISSSMANREKTSKVNPVLTTTKKIIGTAIQKLELGYKSYEYIQDFIRLDRYIFIFDDVERSECQINDLMGYINGLVEHENVKVILVANEKEIGRYERNEFKELQYLVASDAKIQIPMESIFNKVAKTDKEKEDKFNIEEVERRRKKIFSDIAFDGNYKRIREKLIGITIHYEPDFSEIMHKLINRSNLDIELKKKLDENVKSFVDELKDKHHYNLRTFQFFLSKMDYIYSEFNRYKDIESKYWDRILDFLIENCFILCIAYKGNIQEPEDELGKIMYRRRLILHSVDNYVRNSVFAEDEFRKELKQYIDIEVKNKLDDDDPYSLLYNQYYIQPQSWVQEKINEILDKLELDMYQVSIYGKILIQLISMVEIGFDSAIVKRATDLMINNVKDKENQSHISTEFMIEDKKIIVKCKEIVFRINSSLEGAREKTMRQTIEKILDDKEEWGEKLKRYIESVEYEKQNQTTFFNKVDVKRWEDSIIHSNPKNIQRFRECLSVLYPDNVYWVYRKDDMPVIKEIIQKIKFCAQKDLIMKMQVSWLVEQLENIYQNYMEREED